MPDNSVREFDHTPLLASTNNSFIGISIQYRLGAFGFLADPAMASDGGLNAGITDARAALRWVQEYVHLLGGDPERVTIWGQSSGGGTVGQLLAAEAESHDGQMYASGKGNDKKDKEILFQGAMLSSPYMVPMGKCNDSFWKVSRHPPTLRSHLPHSLIDAWGD
jgi:carboxylesterase type B